MRRADHRNFDYFRVSEQRLVNFARIGIGAAGNYDVLGSIVEVKVTVAVLVAQVPGPEPPVTQRLRGRRGIPVYPNKGTKRDIGLSLISDAHYCLPAGFELACNG